MSDSEYPYNNRFSCLISYYMRQKGISVDTLATRCEVSHVFVRKYKRPMRYIPWEVPILFGIGLELTYKEIYDLAEAGGASMPDNDSRNKRNSIIAKFLDLPYPKTVKECNMLLAECECNTLSNLGIIIPPSHSRHEKR